MCVRVCVCVEEGCRQQQLIVQGDRRKEVNGSWMSVTHNSVCVECLCGVCVRVCEVRHV